MLQLYSIGDLHSIENAINIKCHERWLKQQQEETTKDGETLEYDSDGGIASAEDESKNNCNERMDEQTDDNQNTLMEEEPIRKHLQLYTYQKKAVATMIEMEKRNNGGFLCFEMGLGKTGNKISTNAQKSAILINVCKTDPENAECTLIVAPKTLLPNWLQEIERWHPTAKVT